MTKVRIAQTRFCTRKSGFTKLFSEARIRLPNGCGSYQASSLP